MAQFSIRSSLNSRRTNVQNRCWLIFTPALILPPVARMKSNPWIMRYFPAITHTHKHTHNKSCWSHYFTLFLYMKKYGVKSRHSWWRFLMLEEIALQINLYLYIRQSKQVRATSAMRPPHVSGQNSLIIRRVVWHKILLWLLLSPPSIHISSSWPVLVLGTRTNPYFRSISSTSSAFPWNIWSMYGHYS